MVTFEQVIASMLSAPHPQGVKMMYAVGHHLQKVYPNLNEASAMTLARNLDRLAQSYLICDKNGYFEPAKKETLKEILGSF